MNRNILIGLVVVVVVVVLGVGYSFLAPAEEPSAPIAAIPLELSPVAAATNVPAAPEATAAPTEEPAAEPTADSGYGAEATATTEVVATIAPTEEPVAEATEAPASEPVVFEIQQSSSVARFLIDEVLNGNPVTVEGVTDQVAGQIAVDPNNPTSAQVGTILINARGFATDSGNRNNAIKNRILDTNNFEFITFVPTAITGLPESATVGQAVTFQMSGDLTIKDTTNPVTFDVTLTPVSESELTGNASATILYADWGIQIPQVPQVASVSDQVIIQLDFTATPTS